MSVRYSKFYATSVHLQHDLVVNLLDGKDQVWVQFIEDIVSPVKLFGKGHRLITCIENPLVSPVIKGSTEVIITFGVRLTNKPVPLTKF